MYGAALTMDRQKEGSKVRDAKMQNTGIGAREISPGGEEKESVTY